jgi:hypothetical protein
LERNSLLTKMLFAVTGAVFLLLTVKNGINLGVSALPDLLRGLPAPQTAAMLVLLAGFCLLCFALLRLVRRGALALGDQPVLGGERIASWVWYPMVFAAAYALRALWIAVAQTPAYSDYQLFYWVSNQIASGPEAAYLTDPYFQVWAYQVGFPAFLSPLTRLFPSNYTALLYVNCAFEAGTVLCLYHLLSTFLRRNAALCAAALYLLIPFPYMLAPVYTNQFAAAFFLLLGVCVLFARARTAWVGGAVAGLLFALSNALRAEGVLIAAALGALTALGLLFQEKGCAWRRRLSSVLPLLVCLTAYFAGGALLSRAVAWTGLNPHGLENHFPLYKFAIGLNDASDGQYAPVEADRLIHLHNQYPPETRDEITKRLIYGKLSAGPLRLLDLFSRKLDVQWTERYRSYPALIPFAEEDSLTFAGVGLRVSTLKNAVAALQSLWNVLLFALCGALCAVSLFPKRVARLTVFLAALSLITFAAFSLVEVQRRYAYALTPVLFVLALTALAEIRIRSRRRRTIGAGSGDRPGSGEVSEV